MIYGALLPVASLATTLAGAALLIIAAVTAAFSVFFFRRARSREDLEPIQQAESVQAVSEMRALGDRIETLVSQQQLQGETQRQRLGQQIDEVRQVVSQQGHRVDGLRGELHHEMQKRDHEIEEIRQQLTAIQRTAALPQADTAALPPPAPEPLALPAAQPAADAAPQSAAPMNAAPTPAVAPTPDTPPMPDAALGGDSFAGAEALPPPAWPAPSEPDSFDVAAQDIPMPEAMPPAHDTFEDPLPPQAPPPPVHAAEAPPAAAPPAAPEPAPEAPDVAPSVFSDMGFDAFAPGEPAAVPMPERDATLASAEPPDGGAWVSSQREPVPVFAAEEWPEFAPASPEDAPAAEPTAPYTPPADADDFRFISSVTEDVQRALYMAGVTKLEEIAHWSRSDARRISAEVGVSEETIMNQWVFEAQGALFERYSSHVGS